MTEEVENTKHINVSTPNAGYYLFLTNFITSYLKAYNSFILRVFMFIIFIIKDQLILIIKKKSSFKLFIPRDLHD